MEEKERIRKLLDSYKAIIDTIVEERGLEDFLFKIADKLNKIGYYSVTVGRIDQLSNTAIPIYVACKDREYIEFIYSNRIELDDPVPKGSVGYAYLTGKSYIIEKVEGHPATKPWEEDFRRFSIKSSLSIPIRIDDDIRYIIVIHDKEEKAFKEEYGLIEDIEKSLSKFLAYLASQIKNEKQKEFDIAISKILNLIGITCCDIDTFITGVLEVLEKETRIDTGIIFEVNGLNLNYKYHFLKKKELEPVLNIIKEKKYSEETEKMIEECLAKNVIKVSIRRPMCIPRTKDTQACLSLALIPVAYGGNTKFLFFLLSEDHDYFISMDTILNVLRGTIEKAAETIQSKRKVEILHEAINQALDTIAILDESFNFIFVNKKVEEIFGYKVEELIGKNHNIFSSKLHDKDFVEEFYNTLVNKNSTFSGIFFYKDKNNRLHKFFTTIIPYIYHDGKKYYISIGRSLDKEERLLKQIEDELLYDRITKLPSERYFLELVATIISSEKEKTHAIAIIDPIEFEYINSIYGLQFGNKVLKKIGEKLKSLVYEEDIVGKIEKDKFALLIRNVPDESSAYLALYRILTELGDTFEIDGQNIKLELMGSIALYPSESSTPEELLERAKKALITAPKKEHGMIVSYREDVVRTTSEIIKLRSEIDKIIEEKKLVYFWQPIVDENAKICGAEGLLRLFRNGKIIPPNEFIPILERSRIMEKVELRLIEEAMDLTQELKRYKGDFFISVNISPITFESKNFTTKIRKLCIEKPLNSSFHIEITESHLMKVEEKEVLNNLYKLREAGIRVIIDDFGSGYSNFKYLMELELDGLKLDRSIINTLNLPAVSNNYIKVDVRDKDTNKRIKIIETIVKVAKELNIEVIAEGVENKNQFEILKDIGIRYFQGFLFYKPLPLEELIDIIGD
ncbi:MAG: EAL domain-containing protein [Thermosulfidibacteraceae bacterium]|jgi:PAS domain S-box-containing protein/diguanylate cyclase (GGDEF)-like protein